MASLIARSPQAFYAVSVVYLLLTLVIASSYATGTAVRRLEPIEFQTERAKVLASLGRINEVFGPGVIIANLAVSVGLLALSLQIAASRKEDVPPFVDFGGGHGRQAAVVTVSF